MLDREAFTLYILRNYFIYTRSTNYVRIAYMEGRIFVLEGWREAAIHRERSLERKLEASMLREERLAERVEALEIWREEADLREELMRRRLVSMMNKLEEVGEVVDRWRMREEGGRGRI